VGQAEVEDYGRKHIRGMRHSVETDGDNDSRDAAFGGLFQRPKMGHSRCFGKISGIGFGNNNNSAVVFRAQTGVEFVAGRKFIYS